MPNWGKNKIKDYGNGKCLCQTHVLQGCLTIPCITQPSKLPKVLWLERGKLQQGTMQEKMTLRVFHIRPIRQSLAKFFFISYRRLWRSISTSTAMKGGTKIDVVAQERLKFLRTAARSSQLENWKAGDETAQERDRRPHHHPLLHRLPQPLPYCDGPINLFSLPSLGKGFPYQKGIKRGSIGNTSLVSKNVIAAYLHINVISPGKNIFLLSLQNIF